MMPEKSAIILGIAAPPLLRHWTDVLLHDELTLERRQAWLGLFCTPSRSRRTDSATGTRNRRKSLNHAGGGDSQSLAGLVTWALKEYKSDPKNVFVGGSSGAMEATCVVGWFANVDADETDLGKAYNPSYNGTWPKMMVFHGTADTAVTINILKAQLDQWSTAQGFEFRVVDTFHCSRKMLRSSSSACCECRGFGFSSPGPVRRKTAVPLGR
ncbi:Uu.00g104940.m01.CDS01 [Anthostomella pinea]|uniref:Uu.00g104940.m01.CDS01 n=1 Tax=Anthostomella pinea TaxID=933095 RepID=A0AAI8VDX7_9PEZI|nr:Uu.00g104940.m01.CDS01 [Anthostomella pinea]